MTFTAGTGNPVAVSVHVEAGCNRVWRACTDAEELAAWYWPPALRPSVEVDARVGGRYRISAAAPPMAVSGGYLTVEPPRRAVLTWRWDGDAITSTATLTFAPAGAGTDVRVVHDYLPVQDQPAHLQGWTDCLGRLGAHLARPA